MAHNYYLYGDPKRGGRLQWIPWDNNMSFGVTPFRGGGNGPPPGFAPPPGAGAPPAGFPQRGAGPGAGPAGGPPPFFAARFGGAGDVLHGNVGAQWPLIRILIADDVYAAKYRQHLQSALGGLFAPDAFARRARDLHTLIAPYIVGPQGEQETYTTVSSAAAFERSVDGPGGLLEAVRNRQATIREALRPATR